MRMDGADTRRHRQARTAGIYGNLNSAGGIRHYIVDGVSVERTSALAVAVAGGSSEGVDVSALTEEHHSRSLRLLFPRGKLWLKRLGPFSSTI